MGGYDSHAEALKAFAKFTKVTSVIEFGAGMGSTPLFLNREFYQDLISLVSLEHDPTWAKTAKTDDKRHTIIVTHLDNFIQASMDLRSDFVFIDCINGREHLFGHALELAPVFAIHDRQQGEITGFKYVKGFNSHIQTVFASNTVDLSMLEL
jgi:hypothetical protein